MDTTTTKTKPRVYAIYTRSHPAQAWVYQQTVATKHDVEVQRGARGLMGEEVYVFPHENGASVPKWLDGASEELPL